MLSAARSLPVITAMTPGILIAPATSTLRIIACATVARTNTACTLPAMSKSSVNFPRPVTSGASSLRSAWRSVPKRKSALLASCVALRCALMDASVLFTRRQSHAGRQHTQNPQSTHRKPHLATIARRAVQLAPLRAHASITLILQRNRHSACWHNKDKDMGGFMSITTLLRNLICVTGASLLAGVLGAASAFAQQTGPIKIGLLVPLTGPLATPGTDMVDGFKLFWEQVGNTAGGRKVEYVIADTTCNPDQAITQARRLVHQEKVQIMIGPLCGHEGPAVAQVSKETGVPLVMDTAGADDVTKWNRTPTVVRTAVSASQIGHPFGDYLFKELGARNVTFIGQDYTWGHEVTLGIVQTYKELGGKVAKIIWNPIGTKDYGPTVAAIAPDSDAVVAVVVGADRIRLFEAWFSFGMDKKFKIYGGYWMHQAAFPKMADAVTGRFANSLNNAPVSTRRITRRSSTRSPRNTRGCHHGSRSPPTLQAFGRARR